MSVIILGLEDGRAVLVDSVHETVLRSPLFKCEEEAAAFVGWLMDDPRCFSYEDLARSVVEFRIIAERISVILAARVEESIRDSATAIMLADAWALLAKGDLAGVKEEDLPKVIESLIESV